MRPVNKERIIIEYVRINRVLDSGLLSDEVPFVEDVLAVMRSAEDLHAVRGEHNWYLGNLEKRRTADGTLLGVTGQFGYSGAVPSGAPPEYDKENHRWPDESPLAPSGVLALFVLDGPSQVMAVTSKYGDVPMPGFCKALGDLLNKGEMTLSARAGGVRTKRTWEPDLITERGSYEAWARDMDKVIRLKTEFHLPNPDVTPDIKDAVDFLNSMSGKRGAISASNEDGLVPSGNPLLKSALKMQEHDYGHINAKGIKADGTEDEFKSHEHADQDTVPLDPEDEYLSTGGILALLLRQLALRLERGLGK